MSQRMGMDRLEREGKRERDCTRRARECFFYRTSSHLGPLSHINKRMYRILTIVILLITVMCVCVCGLFRFDQVYVCMSVDIL